jgi:hypothetical protein
MKLTIIVPDGAVYENGVCYSGLTWQGTPENVHALQWYETYGNIEYKDDTPNENIDVLPDWALNAEIAWNEAANPPPPPPFTPEQIRDQNNGEAINRLQLTDWAATVDISNPVYSNPYLANQDAFLTYRSAIRAIAVNPPSTLVDPWPTEPLPDWRPAP